MLFSEINKIIVIFHEIPNFGTFDPSRNKNLYTVCNHCYLTLCSNQTVVSKMSKKEITLNDVRKAVLTVPEAVRVLGVSRRTFYNLTKRDDIPFLDLGGFRLYSAKTIKDIKTSRAKPIDIEEAKRLIDACINEGI